MARRLLLLLLVVLTTLHRRVHLKHFELFLYICSLTYAKDNLPTALEHRINCFANEKRHRSMRRLRLLCGRLVMILRFLHFHCKVQGVVGEGRTKRKQTQNEWMWKKLRLIINQKGRTHCRSNMLSALPLPRHCFLSIFSSRVKRAKFFMETLISHPFMQEELCHDDENRGREGGKANDSRLCDVWELKRRNMWNKFSAFFCAMARSHCVVSAEFHLQHIPKKAREEGGTFCSSIFHHRFTCRKLNYWYRWHLNRQRDRKKASKQKLLTLYWARRIDERYRIDHISWTVCDVAWLILILAHTPAPLRVSPSRVWLWFSSASPRFLIFSLKLHKLEWRLAELGKINWKRRQGGIAEVDGKRVGNSHTAMSSKCTLVDIPLQRQIHGKNMKAECVGTLARFALSRDETAKP